MNFLLVEDNLGEAFGPKGSHEVTLSNIFSPEICTGTLIGFNALTI